MTPTERALLLAVAKTLRDTAHPRKWASELDAVIAAVEAEDKPEAPAETVCPSCEGKGRLEYLHYHHRCPDCGGTGKEKK